jgi:hypothetical protein
MVVLARLSGIPARLAIGYATGNLDRTTGQYVVTESQAHSWPELYFPGIGWVPFEPTAYLALPVRRASAEPSLPPPRIDPGPEDLASGMAEIRQSAAVNVAIERRQATNRAVATAALTMALIWAVWLLRRSSRPMPALAGGAVDAFQELAVWGGRLGEPFGPGETPREYALELGRASTTVAESARWRKAHVARAAVTVRSEVMRLTEALEQSLFAPTDSQRLQVRSWAKLWAALRVLWVAKTIGRARY